MPATDLEIARLNILLAQVASFPGSGSLQKDCEAAVEKTKALEEQIQALVDTGDESCDEQIDYLTEELGEATARADYLSERLDRLDELLEEIEALQTRILEHRGRTQLVAATLIVPLHAIEC